MTVQMPGLIWHLGYQVVIPHNIGTWYGAEYTDDFFSVGHTDHLHWLVLIEDDMSW
jgi:hypothetical protein